MKPARNVTITVFVLAVLAVALIATACDSLNQEATTTAPASTTTTWPVNTVFINETADGTSVHLDLGDLLVLRLQGNPSTGYSWKFEGEGDPVLHRQGAFSFVPDSDALGAGGVYQSVSLAVAEGTTFLALNYVGPNDQVDHNYYVDVVVGGTAGAGTTTESSTVVASTEGTEETTPTTETPTTATPTTATATTVTPTTVGPATQVIRLDYGDNGRTIDMAVKDRLLIEMPLHPSTKSTATPLLPDHEIFEVLSVQDSGPTLRLAYKAIAPGRTEVKVDIADINGVVKETWSVKVRVH